MIKLQLGFLFNGYKINRFYWEIVILYRKILIVMLTVFLSTVSPETQVLCCMVVIIGSLITQFKLRPYYTDTLNKMELYSLMVCIITMYAGMFYITGRNYTYMNSDGIKWFFLACICMPNLVFFCFWIYNMAIELLKFLLATKSYKIFRFITFGSLDIDKFKDKYITNVSDDEKDDKDAEDEFPGLKYLINDVNDENHPNYVSSNRKKRKSLFQQLEESD